MPDRYGRQRAANRGTGMSNNRDAKPGHGPLIIALAVAGAGLVSVSLSWLGKWTGVREPVQVSRSHQPNAPSSRTAN